ncbi:MAG TPA: hypothetical protein VNV15_05810, partial [Opitutaceae bacterium]|nr:hypothetical protein [Opitutaceae bacterium]
MQIQKSLLLTLVLGATSALSAQTTLLNDNFSSGPTGYLATSGGINQNSAGGVQAPPASSFWYANSSSYSFSSGPGGSPITYT